MTNGEATAINLLVDYLTASLGHHSGREMPTGDEVRDGLALLADKANKHFMAGANGDDVRAYWLLPDDPLAFAARHGVGLRARKPPYELAREAAARA
jgi:hypothetical protein